MEMNRPTWKTVAVLTTFMALMRLLPHPWNFTPMLGGALYLGATLTTRQGIFAALLAMLAADAFIGTHSGMWFVYAVIAIITIGGKYLRQPSVVRVGLSATVASLVFFILTNFSVWAFSSLYTKDLSGLYLCYSLAIPFFHNTLISSLFYSGVFFSAHAYLIHRRKYPLESMICVPPRT